MNLKEYFSANKRLAIAYSGGVDSAYLLYTALRENTQVSAYYVSTEFQPQFEQDEAVGFANRIGADLHIIRISVLSDENIVLNCGLRCYHCKKKLLCAVAERAAKDGFSLVADGSNASDDFNERPGMRALKECGVASPLRECGLRKEDIRISARKEGLPFWDKPSYSCLATRIATNQQIDEDTLKRVETAETLLRKAGFSDFRVRVEGNRALIQIIKEQYYKFSESEQEIFRAMNKLFDSAELDGKFRERQ